MKTPWPRNRDESANAVQAFSAALTRAGSEKAFRDLLLKSPDDARTAVSDHGNIDIPSDIVIIFHEPEDCPNIFPFYLPKPNEPLRPFSDYYQGCRPKFQLAPLTPAAFFNREKERFAAFLKAGLAANQAETKKSWALPDIAEAFTAVLHQSQIDPGFRSRLTDSMSSAKEALAEVGEIAVPDKVVVLFHEDESNEKYHMFGLPPLNADLRANHDYRAQFEGFYFVW